MSRDIAQWAQASKQAVTGLTAAWKSKRRVNGDEARQIAEMANLALDLLTELANSQLATLVSDMPRKLDFLRDLISQAEESGPFWSGWSDGIRGNPAKCATAIAEFNEQITEGEELLQNALIKLGKS